MPEAFTRKKMAAVIAVMATTAVFKKAVQDIKSMTIAPSGTEYIRPTTPQERCRHGSGSVLQQLP